MSDSIKVSKIVITGGPCAGKTTAMNYISDCFSNMGYRVIFIPESATELINTGISPRTCRKNSDFQKCIIEYQLEKERIYEKAARMLAGAKKLLIVCDRGVMDNKAYMTDDEFSEVLSSLGLAITDMRDRYDAVFHLVSTADGAEDFYTLSNNGARTETVEEAVLLDRKLISAWTGNMHLRIIGNEIDFDKKMRHLLTEISSFLGEPEPYETERKFLIEYPDISSLESDPFCRRIEISQTYLLPLPPDSAEVRVRRRGEDGHFMYFKTVKRKIDDMRRIETETRITESEYNDLMRLADKTRHTIDKIRYCLVYDRQYFEIDVYDFWKDRAVIEIELTDSDTPIKFPPYLNIIGEVTGDDRYKNSSLAKNGGKID